MKRRGFLQLLGITAIAPKAIASLASDAVKAKDPAIAYNAAMSQGVASTGKAINELSIPDELRFDASRVLAKNMQRTKEQIVLDALSTQVTH